MKILTATEMREVDRLTIEAGIPGIILMENAACRVVDFLVARFAPLEQHRIVVLCGKGNNGGDGLAIGRQLFTRFRPKELHIVLAADPSELQGDAAANLRMLEACGCAFSTELTWPMRRATLVVDALLGTGVKGAAEGLPRAMIHAINHDFPDARVVAVDLPSGMASDSGDNEGVCARADATVTFTAPKPCHVLPPNCDRIGELTVAAIGSPASLFEENPSLWLSLIQPEWLRPLFGPRPRGGHKGDFGHVLVVAGSVGKTGAAGMTGLSALRSGAGLVTVASAASAIPMIALTAVELMTERLAETDQGSIASRAYAQVEALAEQKSVMAAGPGLSLHPDTGAFVRQLYERMPLPMILDADGISAISGPFLHSAGPRIFTPHPGEMARLCGCTVAEVQQDRIRMSREFATSRGVTIVLKGQRTVIAFPDGRVWVNPTGSPAMATAGSGDILTGLIAGLLGQFPDEADYAIAAAVWLHGRAGEIGAAALGEKGLIATDLLTYLPEAIRALGSVSHAQ